MKKADLHFSKFVVVQAGAPEMCLGKVGGLSVNYGL